MLGYTEMQFKYQGKVHTIRIMHSMRFVHHRARKDWVLSLYPGAIFCQM